MVLWRDGTNLSLSYAYDATGALTNLWSSTGQGANDLDSYDALGRLATVTANGSQAAAYGYDALGNLRGEGYGNGVTNLYQYDAPNRLTKLLSQAHALMLASFVYMLGPTGIRTNLAQTITNAWTYDNLYRSSKETMTSGGPGKLSYGYDPVGNRTNRTSWVSGITNQSPACGANDWLTTDTYDTNGNTKLPSGVAYLYDPLDRLISAMNGASIVTLGYDGDGNCVFKTAGGVTIHYLVDDRNPSGYAQVIYELRSDSTSRSYI